MQRHKSLNCCITFPRQKTLNYPERTPVTSSGSQLMTWVYLASCVFVCQISCVMCVCPDRLIVPDKTRSVMQLRNKAVTMKPNPFFFLIL